MDTRSVEMPLGDEGEVDALSVVLMRVGARWFGVPAERILEILVKGPITRVPFTPAHMLGLCMVHGRVMPVVAIERLLDLEPGGETGTLLPRLVVVQTDKAEIALPCEEATGVFTVAPPEPVEGQHAIVCGTTSWEAFQVTMIDVERLVQLVLDGTGGDA